MAGNTKTLNELIAALRNASPVLRMRAAESLGRCALTLEGAVSAVPALVGVLNDVNGLVRMHSVIALGHIGCSEHDALVVPAIVNTLKDSQAHVREYSAWALGRIGPGAAEAIPDLATVLTKDSWEPARKCSAWALGQIGPAARDAAPVLLAATADSNQDVRLAAKGALSILGNGLKGHM